MNQPGHQCKSNVKSGPRRWLLPIGLLGVVLIGLAGTYLHFTYSHSVGSGPAGPPVSQQAFARPWLNRDVLMLGLGDSVTAGFGARRGYSYFDRLVSNPAEESGDMKGICLSAVFPHLRTTNLAVSGSVSLDVLESQLPRLPVATPETLGWIVITTGGNDLIHNYGKTPAREHAMYGATWEQAQPWITNFEHRLEAITRGLKDRFPGGCEIFLANIYDPSDGVGDIDKAGLPHWPDGLRILRAYNEAIGRTGTKHPNVHIVNMHESFLGHGIHSAQFWFKHYDARDPHYWFYINLEDPNERGYDAIRRLFLNTMVSVPKPDSDGKS